MKNVTIENIMTFATEVKAAVEGILGSDNNVDVREVLKNNGTRLTGLTIGTKGSNVAPTFYLDGYYEMYRNEELSLIDVAEKVVSAFKTHGNCSFDVGFISDFEIAKERLCFKLINSDRNRNLLLDVPHLEICDLAIVFYLLVGGNESGMASIMVRKAMSKAWGVDEKLLFEVARENTQRLLRGSIQSIGSVISELLSEGYDATSSNEFFDMTMDNNATEAMYVVTNKEKLNGAGVVLYDGLLKGFAERINSDLYILPSSIHETILVPATAHIDPNELRAMVHEVNITQVLPEEVLSDNVYIYRREADCVCIA